MRAVIRSVRGSLTGLLKLERSFGIALSDRGSLVRNPSQLTNIRRYSDVVPCRRALGTTSGDGPPPSHRHTTFMTKRNDTIDVGEGRQRLIIKSLGDHPRDRAPSNSRC